MRDLGTFFEPWPASRNYKAPDRGDPKPQDTELEPLDARFERYLSMFEMTQQRMRALEEAIKTDISICKAHQKKPSEPRGDMWFFDTCVRRCATGKEKGVYYAVDFGGTNLRCVRVELKGNGQYSCDTHKKDVRSIPTPYPNGLCDRKATAAELFDALASVVMELMEKHGEQGGPGGEGGPGAQGGPGGEAGGEAGAGGPNGPNGPGKFPVGFTFSFPCEQTGLAAAKCAFMGKGFETGSDTIDPVQGCNVGRLLNHAFTRNRVPAECIAVLNDTTGTLLSGAYTRPQNAPECMIGLIVGTGLNICYVDPDAGQYGYQGLVINTEVGSLKKALSLNIIDYEVDDADPKPGSQICEKMVSGMYMAEICRRLILKVFRHRAPPKAWAKGALTTEACMTVAYAQESGKANPSGLMREILETQMGWDPKDLSDRDLDMCIQLCRAACRRSAYILAVAIASFAHETGELQPGCQGVCVAVDGSVYVHHKGYQDDVRAGLETYLDKALADLIHFTIAIDGSGVGAAILAAVCSQGDAGTLKRESLATWQK